MQAIVQDTYGSAEVLDAREIEKPVIGDNEVLVRVRAAGVNLGRLGGDERAAVHRAPRARAAQAQDRRPRDGCRRGRRCGRQDVTRFKPGDEVFGVSHGSYAEYAAASEDELALKPANLTFEQAATVPMAGLVALQAIRDHGKVRAGQTVLINGASGGIGTFADPDRQGARRRGHRRSRARGTSSSSARSGPTT